MGVEKREGGRGWGGTNPYTYKTRSGIIKKSIITPPHLISSLHLIRLSAETVSWEQNI